MKKETGIILLLAGFIAGFAAGMITTTAMQPSLESRLEQEAMKMTALPGQPNVSPENYAQTQQADQMAAMKTRKLEEINQLKMLLETDPNNVDVLIALGNDYFDVDQYYASIENYEKALKLDPDMPDVIIDLGIMYRRTDRYKKALETFERAIKVDPKHPNAYLNKAVVYRYDAGEYEKALEMFEKFLELAPSNHPMIPNAKNEIDFLKEEIKHGHDTAGEH